MKYILIELFTDMPPNDMFHKHKVAGDFIKINTIEGYRLIDCLINDGVEFTVSEVSEVIMDKSYNYKEDYDDHILPESREDIEGQVKEYMYDGKLANQLLIPIKTGYTFGIKNTFYTVIKEKPGCNADFIVSYDEPHTGDVSIKVLSYWDILDGKYAGTKDKHDPDVVRGRNAIKHMERYGG